MTDVTWGSTFDGDGAGAMATNVGDKKRRVEA